VREILSEGVRLSRIWEAIGWGIGEGRGGGGWGSSYGIKRVDGFNGDTDIVVGRCKRLGLGEIQLACELYWETGPQAKAIV
jgi:hypothetical protein